VTANRWSILSVLSLAGCAAAPAKPAVDVAAEERTIHALTDSLAAAEVRRDTVAILNGYADDAILQVPGLPSLVGREAWRPVVREFLALPFTGQVMKDRTVVVAASGDLAYDIGADNHTTKNASGETVEAGKSIIIYSKIDGRWRVVANSYSTDAAAGTPLPTETPK
jgi:uncharacterized protein (TIGR02246 family)